MTKTSTGFKCLFCEDKVMTMRRNMCKHIQNIHFREKAFKDNLEEIANASSLNGTEEYENSP